MAKHPELTEARIQWMVNGYNSGMTIRDLAAEFGYSYTGMHTILWREGVKFRGRGVKKGSEAASVAAKKGVATKRAKAAKKAIKATKTSGRRAAPRTRSAASQIMRNAKGGW